MLKFFDSAPVRYIRTHPFSTMALANIVGDASYVGFAFHAQGFVSWPKLFGALFACSAHIILLAYGDSYVQRIADEQGAISRLLLKLRTIARRITTLVPSLFQKAIKSKPVGVTFTMLTINGFAFLADAIVHVDYGNVMAVIVQGTMGVLVALGTGAFAVADFTHSQRLADLLTKLAPSILVCASVANLGLVLATGNPFMILSFLAFTLSNFAGFFTRIDKNSPYSRTN